PPAGRYGGQRHVRPRTPGAAQRRAGLPCRGARHHPATTTDDDRAGAGAARGEGASGPMSTTSPLAAAPVVAEVVRNDVVESVHHGIVALTAADGSLQLAVGPVDAPVLPRSSLKPLQALAMLRAGADLEGPLLALTCASHSGEPAHLEGSRRILAAAGLDENALQNTPDLPIDDRERARWEREGLPPSSLGQNCSGKHAGMLLTCVA